MPVTTIALLRAVNVGGRGGVAMAAVREVLSGLGLTDVRTVLQSGNAVFEADGPAGHDLEAAIATALERQLGLSTVVLCRTAEEWTALVAANPFLEAAARDPSHLLAMPLMDTPGEGALASLRQAIRGREVVELAGRTLYAVYPDGIGTSKLTTRLIEAQLATQGTARNWNTVLKLAAVAARSQTLIPLRERVARSAG